LAAISSAYPPELSIHPERIEASRERKTPVYKEKLGPKGTIAKATGERKGKTAKIAGKTHFF